MDAGEAIVFTYTQHVELDGPQGLSGGSRSLVEKKKGKYRLRDFSERGDQEKLGLPGADSAPVPLIDILHRVLYLMEHYPRKLAEFLEEARPDRERLRLLAQVLGGVGLAGGNGEKTEHQVTTTPAEKATLGKLLANWRHLIEQSLGEVDPKTGQQRLGF
jgi:putative DNA methylase